MCDTISIKLVFMILFSKLRLLWKTVNTCYIM